MGGNHQITSQRRDWVIGYLTACGFSENVLEAAAGYDDSDSFEHIMSAPRMAMVQKVLLYDALRACAMARDGFSPLDFDPVLRAADEIGLPREVVTDLHEIVIEETRLRQRRHDIVVAPALPKLLNDSIAATTNVPGACVRGVARDRRQSRAGGFVEGSNARSRAIRGSTRVTRGD